MNDGRAGGALGKTLSDAQRVLLRVYDAGFQAQWLGADLGCRRDLKLLADRVLPLLSRGPSASSGTIEATLAQIGADLEVICRAIPGYCPEGIPGLDPRRVGPSALASILAGAGEVRVLEQAKRDVVQDHQLAVGPEAPREPQEADAARRRAGGPLSQNAIAVIFFGADCIGDDTDVNHP